MACYCSVYVAVWVERGMVCYCALYAAVRVERGMMGFCALHAAVRAERAIVTTRTARETLDDPYWLYDS